MQCTGTSYNKNSVALYYCVVCTVGRKQPFAAPLMTSYKISEIRSTLELIVKDPNPLRCLSKNLVFPSNFRVIICGGGGGILRPKNGSMTCFNHYWVISLAVILDL